MMSPVFPLKSQLKHSVKRKPNRCHNRNGVDKAGPTNAAIPIGSPRNICSIKPTQIGM